MRERLTGGSQSKIPVVPHSCPHLGLAQDPFSHHAEPSAEHRCYLWMQRERIDVAHQQRFCLTNSHPTCPWMAIAPAEPSTGRIGRIGQSWRRLSLALREQFDHLELVTMRASWPRAMAAVGVFVVQMSAQALAEGRRVVVPMMKNGLAQGRRIVAPVVAGDVLHKPRKQTRTSEGSSAPVVAPAIAEESPQTMVETGAMPGTTSPSISGDQSTSRSKRSRRAKLSETDPAPANTTRTATRWECLHCQTYNLPTAIFCKQCGRLSPVVEEELRVDEEFLVLDGIRALRTGDEETAHRFFVLATESDPESEAAWYWRARAAATPDEVIRCLEQMLSLDPENGRARRDLDVARSRREHHQVLSAARAKAQAPEPTPKRKPPTLAQRMLAFGRRLALESASIPSFALALLLSGEYVIEALKTIGVQGLDSVVPAFRLPTLMLALPADLTEPLLPSTVNVTDVALVVAAIWYLWLAFQLADGTPRTRYWGIAGGLVALAAIPLIVASGRWFLVAAVLLFGLALIGKGTSPNRETYGTIAASGAS